MALSATDDTLAKGGTGLEGNGDLVFVFARTDGTWTEPASVAGAAGDGFGGSVALSDGGDTLAVGASGEDSSATGVDGDQDDNSAPGSGAVYLFRRADNTWTQQAYAKASNTDAGDKLGHSVSLSASADTLAVGAPASGAVRGFH